MRFVEKSLVLIFFTFILSISSGGGGGGGGLYGASTYALQTLATTGRGHTWKYNLNQQARLQGSVQIRRSRGTGRGLGARQLCISINVKKM